MPPLASLAAPDPAVAGPGPAGLTAVEAARRLATDGPNELHRAGPTPRWRIFLQQLRGAMVWLLVGACVMSALLGEVADALAIGAILVLNAVIGFFQESRAERAVLALRSMTAPRARVLRDGHSLVVSAADVVRGVVHYPDTLGATTALGRFALEPGWAGWLAAGLVREVISHERFFGALASLGWQTAVDESPAAPSGSKRGRWPASASPVAP